MSKKSNCIFAIVLCTVVGILMTVRTVYIHYMLTQRPTAIVTARITDIYIANHGIRLSGPEFECEYVYNNEKRTDYFSFSEKKWKNLRIGDCVQLIISKEARRVRKWNQVKGVFRCDSIMPTAP